MHQSAKSFHGRAAPPTQHVQEVGERVEYQLYGLATLGGAADKCRPGVHARNILCHASAAHKKQVK